MKEIFQRLYRLVRFPQREWNRIAEENAPISELRYRYVLPLMCFVIIATFLNVFFDFTYEINESITFEYALKICSKKLVICISSIFIGFHVAVLIINSRLTTKLFKKRPDYHASARLVTFTISLYLIVKTIATLFSVLFFIYATLFYLFYIIWYSIPSTFPELEKEKYTKFTLYAFVVICASPILMETLMSLIMKL